MENQENLKKLIAKRAEAQLGGGQKSIDALHAKVNLPLVSALIFF